MRPYWQDEFATIYHGDCREVLPNLEGVTAVVTDPPYNLGFMGKKWDTFSAATDPAFGYWLAGFVDGEGCFRVQRHTRGTATCTFQIKVRKDDSAILKKIQSYFGGIGRVNYQRGSGNQNDLAVYLVQDKAGCLEVARHFIKYPLRAKKGRDFVLWAEAVFEWNNMKRGNRWHGRGDYSKLLALKRQIESVRAYRSTPWSGNAFQDDMRLFFEAIKDCCLPGAPLFAFGGTRTQHRLICAIEDAGWTIRDCLMWLYGSGFPKSLDISKALDKAAGINRERMRGVRSGVVNSTYAQDEWSKEYKDSVLSNIPIGTSAKLWHGWGTALKPAWEPICLAMKPVEGNFAKNAKKHGVAGLWIEGGRIGLAVETWPSSRSYAPGQIQPGGKGKTMKTGPMPTGRWPANVVLDEKAAGMVDAQSGSLVSGTAVGGLNRRSNKTANTYGAFKGERTEGDVCFGDQGGASRFFYTAKADKSDRGASNRHPTVKPTDLMMWLVKLARMPKDNLILDPFMGSGSTLVACKRLGLKCIGIDLDPGNCKVAANRVEQENTLGLTMETEDNGALARQLGLFS